MYHPSDEEVRITMSHQWLKRLIVKFGLTTVENDASRAKLLDFWKTLRHECENKPLYEAWWFCGGHERVGHISWNFGKIYCHSLKYCNLWTGIFKAKCYQEPLASFIQVGHFGCFDASIIMRDRVGDYSLEGNIELWGNMRNLILD